MNKRLQLLALPLLCCTGELLVAQTISLEQAMADPDWIGRAPEQPYWSDDSDTIYYSQKRQGVEQKDLYSIGARGGAALKVEPEQLAEADVAGAVISSNGRLKVYIAGDDVFVKELRSQTIRQLTRSLEKESNPSFTADSEKVIFYRGDQLLVRNLSNGLEYAAADIRIEASPAEEQSSPSYLESQQLRLFQIIQLEQQKKQLATENENQIKRLDPSRVGLPFYIGPNEEIRQQSLSPDERWLTVVVRNKELHKPGRTGAMPNYVTESGYTQTSELRARVGTTEFASERLLLLDRVNHKIAELNLSELDNLNRLPAQDQLISDGSEADTQTRALRFFGLEWTHDGSRLLFNAVSTDNKDRWLVTIDAAKLELSDAATFDFSDPIKVSDEAVQLIHHHHDPAWINRQFIQAHWLKDNESVFYLSEADGYGHLYLYQDSNTRQLTKGDFEVREPTLDDSNNAIYFRGNLGHPTVWEVYRLELASAQSEQLTQLGGMNLYSLAPDEKNLLIVHSEALRPPELYVQRTRVNAQAVKITNTISSDFDAIDWAKPEFVEVRSSFSQDPIHSRVYTPNDQSRNRPAVVFIHGAGYLQNAHQGWSSYFREFMFHTFLVQQGFVVLDMDYRASSGYGRDWRTAIYRQMGTPEVQDLANGIDYLVANKNVDRARVCAYGGSYGGFLTLMSLFTKPDLFACGAALRPVTDWATYNHGYTSNILNIPELDPKAYEKSSPIEFAEGLNKPLLIAHGMQDDNVFFQDSVRLVQRLIELEKTDFELAIYPIEAHGFRQPSSWLDEYRRIFSLVKATINSQ
jgi:dipeptidyl aminopeptidase/acylaminoacyl peptidase